MTLFLDFEPFLKGFQKVNEYLDKLWADMLNPYHYRYLFVPIGHVIIDPSHNDSHIENFLSSRMCIQRPYACQAKMKFEQFQWEIHYIKKIFHSVYKKFLTAIDHIKYHPSQIQTNITRSKRSIMYGMYGHYYSPTKILTPSEEKVLTAFMNALYKINPALHKNLSRMKRISVFGS